MHTMPVSISFRIVICGHNLCSWKYSTDAMPPATRGPFHRSESPCFLDLPCHFLGVTRFLVTQIPKVRGVLEEDLEH